MTTKILATASMILALAAHARDMKLGDLIPSESWEKAGITKLTESERVVLRDEIVALLQRYRMSLADGVAVIAPSISTSIKAREIRTQLKKSEVPFRYAEAILVVVRGLQYDPLQYSYESLGELQRDADNQLNIYGPKYHVYLYSMNDNLAVVQVLYRSFEAE
jgi:hypothetical protein